MHQRSAHSQLNLATLFRVDFCSLRHGRFSVVFFLLDGLTSVCEFFANTPLAGPRRHGVGSHPVVAGVVPKVLTG